MWDLGDLLQEIATITRRWPPHRIKFLEEYVFAPKHAELLRTRESKRENEAFDRGEYLDPMRIFSAEPDRTCHARRIRCSGLVGCDCASLSKASCLKGSDRVHEPSAVGVRKLHPSHLLPCINDQAVRNRFAELFFDSAR